MKNAQKRILSLFLALALILSIFPMPAAAVDLSKISALTPQEVASGTCGDNLTWVLDDSGTLTISGSGDMIDSINMNDYGWSPYCYSTQPQIKQLVLPEGLTSIGSRAFESTFSLTGQVDIPEGVTCIGNEAFFGSKITAVSIPVSVQKIGRSAFDNKDSLKNVYYAGSKSQWEQIDIHYYNSALNTATIHYALSDPAPAPSTAPTPSTAPAAPKGITVLVNGAPVQFDVQPQIINSRTMVPLRAIFEALGASVEWDGENRAIYSAKGDTYVTLWVNNPMMVVTRAGKTETKTLDMAPVIKNSRTLVPVRAIAEAYGCEVGWDQASKTVTIAAAPTQTPTPVDDGRMLKGETIREQSAYICDNGTVCYSFVKKTDMYIYDGNEVRTYPAGGIPRDIVAVGNNIYYRTAFGSAVYVMDQRTGRRDILLATKGVGGFAIYRGKMFVWACGDDNKSCLYMIDLDTRKSTLLYEVAEKNGIRFNFVNSSAIAFDGDYVMLVGLDYEQEYKEGRTAILSGFRININTGVVSEWFTTESLLDTDQNYYITNIIDFSQNKDDLYLSILGAGPYGAKPSLYYKVDIPTETYREITFEEYHWQKSNTGAEIDRTWKYGYSNKSVSRTHRSNGLKETLFEGDDYAALLAHNDDKLVVFIGPANGNNGYRNGTIYVMDPDGSGARAISINHNGTITNYSGGGTNIGSSGSSGGNTTPEPRSCTACSGRGEVKCPACGGTGDASFIMLGRTVKQDCVPCNHTGWIQCGECGGRGSK